MKLVCPALLGSVQSLSHVQLSATPWAAARQASLSIINTQSLLKLMSNESVMPSNLSSSSDYQVGIQNNSISYDFFICTNGFFAPISPFARNVFLPSI